MNTTETRSFVSSDIEAVFDLVQSAIHSSYTDFYPERAVQYFLELNTKECILERADKGLTLLAVKADQVVGVGTVINNSISSVYVSKSEQGKGVGRLLMSVLESNARQNGHLFTTLSVSIPSRGFYEALGYKDFEEKCIDANGQDLLYWVASKRFNHQQP